ncbi:hypothetical protein [Bradyrhizobium sp. Leo170]|uniref:hypothetical protein n=1 Tax=Bradyrhizobium sp. Leo170 TaxID=1571199 RepID=UPI001FDEB188|nr:hypothetical protein [Bradyrhizobium sp. Leo170]
MAFSAGAQFDVCNERHMQVVSNFAAVHDKVLKPPLDLKEEPMKFINLSILATSTAAMRLAKTTALAAVLMSLAPMAVAGDPIEKKGTTPYVTHFIFRPLMTIDTAELGKATTLEAVGTTQNMKGEKMLDKMSARCVALNVASGDKKYIDGACVLADSDGDKIFSTFDTRDLDKSQPKLDCGTHIITGGTGKYKGITGSEPFACISMPALAGPGDYFAMDIPHNTSWEIK